MKRISRQLEAKLALRFAGFLIAISIFIYFYFVNSFEDETLDKFRYKTKIFSNYLEQNPQFFQAGNLKNQSQIIELINLNDAIYIILEDANGLKIDTIGTKRVIDNANLVTKPVEGVLTDERIICISSPIVVNKQEIGNIYVGYNVIDTIADLQRKKLIIALISLLLLLTGLYISFLLASFSFKPIATINTILDKSIKEDNNIKINYTGPDKIGELAIKINSILTKNEISSGEINRLKKKLRGDFKEKIKELEFEIKQRKQVELSLQTSEEQFRLLFENAPIGMVMISPDLKIKNVNKSFNNTLGYEANELNGLPIDSLLGGDTCAESIFGIAKSNNKRFHNPSPNQKMIKKNGTEIQVILKSDTICDLENKVKHYIMQVLDITEIIRVQKELAIALAKANESGKLKDAFLAQMSHEIRTPLNVILTAVPLLAEEIGDKDEDIQTVISSVGSAGKRLQRTIDMILNMSAVQSGYYKADFENVNLVEELKKLSSEFKSLCDEKGLKLEFKCSTENPLIWLDKYTVIQIFQNLIGNAIKYTKKGYVRIVVQDIAQDKMRVSVEDSGIGMSQKFMQEIFSPFSQEDCGQRREYEGNGLGLSLVKKFSEINNATVKVQSQKNAGSVFSVTFVRGLSLPGVNERVREEVNLV